MTRRTWRIVGRAIAALGAGAALEALAAWHAPAPAYVGADFGVSAGIAVISLIANLFGLFGGKIDKNVKRALEGLRSNVVGIAHTLAEFARDTGGMFARVVKALRSFLVDVVKPLLLRADKWITRFFAWLKKTLDPILKILQRLRDQWLRLYAKWLLPIFTLFAAVRYTLKLLDRIGFDWAGDLEQKIGRLEDKLVLKIGLVAAAFNDVIDFLNKIITVDGLLSEYTLFTSHWRRAGDMFALMWNTRTFGLSGSGKQHVISGGNAETPLEIQTEIRDAIRADVGPLAPFVTIGIDYTRERLAEA
jgi:hypothetical protein